MTVGRVGNRSIWQNIVPRKLGKSPKARLFLLPHLLHPQKKISSGRRMNGSGTPEEGLENQSTETNQPTNQPTEKQLTEKQPADNQLTTPPLKIKTSQNLSWKVLALQLKRERKRRKKQRIESSPSSPGKKEKKILQHFHQSKLGEKRRKMPSETAPQKYLKT